MLFCQSLAGGIIVVGWTYRLAQRSALKFWFSQSAAAKSFTDFADFAAEQVAGQELIHWPNWFAQQNFRQTARTSAEVGFFAGAAFLLRSLVQSLWLNFWIGLRAIANTWAVTLPACVLWWFGWYDGWNNSFGKGYEQAIVGPLLSLFGIAWFIAAMFYLPLAQARQAVTGQWRSFYQFRLIRQLAKERWIYCVLLAGLYSLLSIPLSIMKTSPMFWMHNDPALGALTGPQVIAAMKSFFFWCALFVLPAFVILRLVAARIYASGLILLVQSGKITFADLAANERTVFERLGLLTTQPEPELHPVIRAAAWTGTRVGRVCGRGLLIAVWFSFVAQIYISEFLNYHSGLAWLNQPLVQLPWFRFLPLSLRNPMADLAAALLLILLATLVRSMVRSFRVLRSGRDGGQNGLF